MAPNLLILAGTTEATALSRRVAEAGMRATLSFAGRVEHLKPQVLPVRIGGFGGAEGLADYIRAHNVTHLIDATHPFAAQMSRNALSAAAATEIPLAALTRPAWSAKAGDLWRHVPDIAAAAAALPRETASVFLAVGRMHLAEFSDQPQHSYLLRLVDAPNTPLPLPTTQIILDRGPFNEDADRKLLVQHKVEVIVSKNSGGAGAYAKIAAARTLNIPVIMVDRPAIAHPNTMSNAQEILDWVSHSATERGV